MNNTSKSDLEQYFATKKEFYSQPEELEKLEHDVDLLLQVTTFGFTQQLMACWTFEFLLFIITVPEGKTMFIKLLNHASRYCPKLAEKYWKIYDNQEDIIEKYYMPSLEMPNLKRLLNKFYDNEEE